MATCDINAMLANNPCFLQLSEKAQMALIADLLCNISSSGGGGGLPTGPQSANTILAGPTSGPAAAPTFRSMVNADLGTTLTPQVAQLGIGQSAGSDSLDITTSTPFAAPINAVNVQYNQVGGASATGTALLINGNITGTTQAVSIQVSATQQIGLGWNGIVTCVAVKEAAVAIGGTNIDWNTGGVFTKTLAASVTFTFGNVADGKTIKVVITGDASHTVTWPAVKWAGGVAPVQTLSKDDVYTFFGANGVIYGSAVQNMS